MTTANRRQFIVVSLLAGLILTAGCTVQNPYKIGFVAGLTGRQSDIGVAGRNGAILAVEEVNKAGGIGGKPVELIVRDDHNDPALVQSIDEELINSGVTAIIGHMTSVTAAAALPIADSGKAVLITPTATADILTNRDDMLLTVMSPVRIMSEAQAALAVNKFGIKRMVVIYDTSNPEYTQNWVKSFSLAYQQLGGRIVGTFSFVSGNKVEYEKLVNEALKIQSEGVLVVAGAVDTAMLVQWLKKSRTDLPLFSSSWAMTADFIQHGGQAVEGVLFSSPFIPDDSSPANSQFVSRYQARFGVEPSYAAAYGYEAAQILLAGITQAGTAEPHSIKKVILAQGKFSGLHGDITINATGDIIRICRLITVNNGQFITMGE